jgi:acetoacetyl-CoA reductase
VFNVTNKVIEGMIEAGFGRIINISSSAQKGQFGQVNYSTAESWPAAAPPP